MTTSTARLPLSKRLGKRLERYRERLRFAASLRHIHGPRRRFAAPEEVTLVALVRNGSYYLDAFFDYYQGLGIRHFVFFDNGSDDDTITQIRKRPGTAILQSRLPWGAFENAFRSYAARRYATDRWCLIVDMDEIFDFQGRADIGLTGLVQYLSANGYTAFMAQMLEMFPKAPLRDVAKMPYPEVLEAFSFYDLSAISAYPYHSADTGLSFFLNQNHPKDANAPQVLFGGVRAKVFGEACCLTKHPLLFVGPAVQAGVHPHAASGVRVAPMTGLIKHYKFADDALARDRKSVETASIAHGEDKLRLERLSKQPDLSLWSEAARETPDIATLQDLGFLKASEDYDAYLREMSRKRTGPGKSVDG
ncbi:glycosyltransferase family 2 protein [Phycobacter sp. K97]|uniref:glycosyltransferase family 2 protein n=1 Tax=Phycobacter sedimenti TaxID=3133977 RepID=UPI00311F73B1